VGGNVYNHTLIDKSFSAGVCTVGPAITETGAAPSVQLAWMANINTICPGLTPFIYWDGIGGSQNYTITNPAVFSELYNISQWQEHTQSGMDAN
jgi:hypothetical protein